MALSEELELYLNDHLAGAAAGVDLIRRISKELGGAAGDLAADIEADREFLEELIKGLEVREHAVKQAISSFVEKLAKLKTNAVVSRSSGLALLLEMEAMAMGIQGKQCLWDALEAAQPSVPGLAGIDFGAMRARADDQQSRLEAHRRAVAAAVAGSPAG